MKTLVRPLIVSPVRPGEIKPMEPQHLLNPGGKARLIEKKHWGDRVVVTSELVKPGDLCLCFNCLHPLSSGLAHTVIDATGTELPVGPDCFTKLTGLPEKTPTVLGRGDMADHTAARAIQLSYQFNKTVDVPGIVRNYARSDVLLRAAYLPQRGFSHMHQARFTPFMARIDALTPDDVAEINRRVAAVTRDPRQDLLQLQRAATVYGQIGRMLASGKASPTARSTLQFYREELRNWHGLVDSEMETLQRWAAIAERRDDVTNAITDLSFPANQARYDAYHTARPQQATFAF